MPLEVRSGGLVRGSIVAKSTIPDTSDSVKVFGGGLIERELLAVVVGWIGWLAERIGRLSCERGWTEGATEG